MKNANHRFPAWLLFLLILLLGILFMLGAGQVAIQLAPSWNLIADVDSNIKPNDRLIVWSNSARIEPVSAAILTQPAWRATYLTPGASIFVPPIAQGIPASTSEANSTPLPAVTQGPGSSVTPGQPTAGISSTPVIFIFPSNTAVPKTAVPTKISTSIPTVTPTRTGTATVTATRTLVAVAHTATPTGTSTGTATVTSTSLSSTATPTGTATVTPSDTATPTGTATVTSTSLVVTGTSTATATSTSIVMTSTETPTAIATATALPACKTTIDLNNELNPHSVSGQMTCFTFTTADSAYSNGGIFQIASTTADGNLHGGCNTKSLSPGNSIDYGVTSSGGVMTFRINVTTPGSLTVNIAPWATYPTCP